jgi:class 3 adenylate cyclase
MAQAQTAGHDADRSGRVTALAVGWVALLVLPLAGFWILIAAPSADVHWEDHPAHFWLVLATALISALLAYSTGGVARRRGDARLFLVSLGFLAAAGFLGLHALATPGVLLDTRNAGFTIATPVGLVLASVFAAASAMPLTPDRAQAVMRHARLLQTSLLAVMAAWGAVSLASVAPLDDPTPIERASGGLVIPAAIAVALYAIASVRYLQLYRKRPTAIPLAIVTAFALLAEATIAVAWARNWHASWWEWHLLMLLAFGAIAWSAQREESGERFSDLYLDETAAGTREVTVLFADLEGYTSYSERHQPRDVSQMLNAYFEVAIPPIVRKHGGEIDRLIGDAIMATFNTRGDQPDHAVRAARAALDLQEAARELHESNPRWPRFRVGINTGEAMVGVVGAGGGRSYTVIGDTVNLASRLEGAAPVGGVALGAGTLRGLPGARVRSLGPVKVKGKAEPVDAFVLESIDDLLRWGSSAGAPPKQ